MTTCELITRPIIRMVDEGKTLDEIAKSICPTVDYGREKIIRIIYDFLGEDYLKLHAETLDYNVKMAEMARKGAKIKKERKDKGEGVKKPKALSHKKLSAIADSEPKISDKKTCRVVFEKEIECKLVTDAPVRPVESHDDVNSLETTLTSLITLHGYDLVLETLQELAMGDD